MKILDLKFRMYKLQIQYMGLATIWTLQKKKISELEERATETGQLRHGDEKRRKRLNRKSVDCGKWSNIHVIRVLEGEEKEKMWKKNHFNSLPPNLIKISTHRSKKFHEL